MSIQDYNFKSKDFLFFIEKNPGVFEQDEKLRIDVVRNMLIDLFFHGERQPHSVFSQKKEYANQVLSAIIEHNPQFVFLSLGNTKSLFYSTLMLEDIKILEQNFTYSFFEKIIQAALETPAAPHDISDKKDLKKFVRNYFAGDMLKPVLDNGLLSVKTLELIVQETRKNKKHLAIFERYLLDSLTGVSTQSRKPQVMKI